MKTEKDVNWQEYETVAWTLGDAGRGFDKSLIKFASMCKNNPKHI